MHDVLLRCHVYSLKHLWEKLFGFFLLPLLHEIFDLSDHGLCIGDLGKTSAAAHPVLAHPFFGGFDDGHRVERVGEEKEEVNTERRRPKESGILVSTGIKSTYTWTGDNSLERLFQYTILFDG